VAAIEIIDINPGFLHFAFGRLSHSQAFLVNEV